MKKTMNQAMKQTQIAKNIQERSMKRMLAYQKKADQVNKKKMNHHMIRKG